MITSELAKQGPPGLASVHLNFYPEFEPPVGDPPTPGTKPQTIGYGLTDSPTGQAAWIYEKFVAWTDSGGDPESVLGLDQMIDAIMLYWLPATAASSARLYWEANRGPVTSGPVKVPVGFSVFPGEIVPLPKVWADRTYGDKLAYFHQLPRGGRFAAFEQPALFVDELRKWGRLVR